jgi:2,4-dienoyl-CoA reductase-like NADH-dependent reductase (Old Yellow Enzyme family)
MAQHRYLFSPLKVGPITIKNRIIFGPHVTGHWSPDFLATPRARAYYEARARGGVGMIIIGASSVDETADYFPFTQPGVFKDEVIPGHKEIADSVHRYGCKIVQQMMHPGIHQIPERNTFFPARAPSQISAVEEPLYIPKELEVEEIVEIEEKFARAAERIKRAGFDGVEVHGAHGYLIEAFLTPLQNKRTDEYGGSLENRFRFYREVLEKVRARVGRDFVVGTRIGSSDMYPGGLEVDDSVRIAEMVEATGTVDYINVTMGLYHSLQFLVPTHYSGFEPGYQGQFTRKIKAGVKSLPVFQVGRINDAALAESIIAEGGADAVVMVRALIAEPELAKRAEQNRTDEIRPCIYCNEKCLGHIVVPGSYVECNVNPVTGQEHSLGSATVDRAAGGSKRVLVVGAGPGGLECARTAAQRGYEVVVYEREKTMGGQVRLLGRLPGRSEPLNIVDWLEKQVRAQGVELKLGVGLNEQNLDAVLAAERPDAVVVATGARAARDGRSGMSTEPIPGWESRNVLSYEEVLDGARQSIGERVLIVDELGDRIAPGIAELLAGQGRKVEVITRWPNLFHVWSKAWNEASWVYGRLDELGVKVTPFSWVRGIEGNAARCFFIFSGREWETSADSFVLVTMKYSNTGIYTLLKQRGVKPLHLIGDAKAPRHIGDAIRDGHLAARAI